MTTTSGPFVVDKDPKHVKYTVKEEWIDMNQHMNVMHYIEVGMNEIHCV